MTDTLIAVAEWYEPTGASSPRGWLHKRGRERALGFYLDYGPEHYRSPHKYCRPDSLCPECQPGNVLACIVDGPSRYHVTVDEARAWVDEQVHA